MKGSGYLVSIVSVLLLGIVGWPGPSDPKWKMPVVIAGMAASIIGMALRYLSYRKEQRDKERAGIA